MTTDQLLAVIAPILDKGFGAMIGDLTPAIRAAFAARGLDVVRILKIRADLRSVIGRHAADFAARRAGELLRDFASTTPAMLRSTVTQAIAEGWSGGKLRQVLRENYAFSPSRAMTISRTETAIARRAGGRAAAQECGARQKRWVIASDDACVLCQTNFGMDWIALDDEFPESDNPHPNCTCGVDYRIEESADDDLADAA